MTDLAVISWKEQREYFLEALFIDYMKYVCTMYAFIVQGNRLQSTLIQTKVEKWDTIDL